MLLKKIQNKIKKGSVMIYGILIIGITSFVLLSIMQFIISNLKLGFYAEPKEQARQAAEAGIYFYRWYLGHNLEGKTSTQIGTFWANAIGVDDNKDGNCDDIDVSLDNYDSDDDGDIDGDDTDGTEAYVSVYTDGNGNDIGYYSICVMGPTEYFPSTSTIKVTGWTKDKPNIKHITTARLRKPSWSEYVILTNKYSKFDSSATIYGPIHGNEGFELDNATINNIVYSSVKEYYNGTSTVDGVNGSATFNVGTIFPVQKIDFQNAVSDFESIKNQAIADSLYYDDSGYGRYIELNSDGTINVSVVTNYDKETLAYTELGSTNINVSIADNAVIYVENNVWVDGTLGVGKNLTIAAHDSRSGYDPSIYLGDNDLEYSSSTGTSLGLMSENNILFVRDSKDDLYIDASLFAMNGGIGWIPPNGTDWSAVSLTKLTIYGSLASNKRMKFKHTGAPNYGFMVQNIVFNAILNDKAPPMFPSGERIEIDRWDEVGN